MFKIRKIKKNEIDEVAKLFNQYRIFYRTEPNLKKAKKFIKKRIKRDESIIYIAIKENIKQIVGFTQLYPLFSSVSMKPIWLLNDLFVDENFRGNGISKLLIDKAKELTIETKSCKLTLQTEKTNNIGNKLYVQERFKLDVEINQYAWENK